MIAYASATNGERNLGMMERHGWRLLFTPFSTSAPSSRFRFCLDNGAWSSFQKGTPFDERSFSRHLCAHGADADFVVIPDIVAGGIASLEFSCRWMRRVLDETERALLPVQNGMVPADVLGLIGPRVGLFVGGDTSWKLATMDAWAAVARAAGAWVHVGRVNSALRIGKCAAAGVTSFDGSSPTRFSVTTPMLSHARDQPDMFKGQQ